MFLNAGLINNPYKDITSNISFEEINVDNVTNESFISAYRYLARIVYSNIISNYIYLIMNYIQIDLLESMHTLNKKGKNSELSKIYEWSNSLMGDMMSNNYSVFTSFMDSIYQKLYSKEITEISIDDIDKFITNLFTRLSTQIITSLNSYETSTYTIDQSKIQTIFERDFSIFSNFRNAFFYSCNILFKDICKNNQFDNSIYKYVTEYFDESNNPEYKRFLTDDISLLYRIRLILSKNIINSRKNDNYKEILNSNYLLIATSDITIQLIYTLSDCSPLLLNQLSIVETGDGSELNFDKLYKKNMTGGIGGLQYLEYDKPFIIQGIEVTEQILGKNLPDGSIIYKLIHDSGGNIVRVYSNIWTKEGERMATKIVEYSAQASVVSYSFPILMAGSIAGALVAGTIYYYYGDAIVDTIKENLGIGVKTDIGTSVPTGETAGETTGETTGETSQPIIQKEPETKVETKPETKFDASKSLGSPEMFEARERELETKKENDERAQKQYESNDPEFKKTDIQERAARKKEYSEKQEAYKAWEKTLVSQNVPTYFESKINEFNEFTKKQATTSLGMDSRFQTSHQLGMTPGKSSTPKPTTALNLDVESAMNAVNSGLFLINIGIKLWRNSKGMHDDESAKEIVRQNLQIVTKPSIDRTYDYNYEEFFKSPVRTYDYEYAEKFQPTEITDKPSYLTESSFNTDLFNEQSYPEYKSYDDSFLAKKGNLSQEYQSLEKLLEYAPEDLKDQVKKLASEYEPKNEQDIKNLIEIAENINKINQNLKSLGFLPTTETPKTTIASKITEKNKSLTGTFELENGNAESIFLEGKNKIVFNWFDNTFSTIYPKVITSTTGSYSVKQNGGMINKIILEKMNGFIISIIELKIINGLYFFLIKDDILEQSNNIINLISISNSISFLDNLYNISMMYQKSNATVINNFINNCNLYLEHTLFKGGNTNKKIKNKTYKNKILTKHKNTNKNKKYNKITIKNIKKMRRSKKTKRKN
jgi:hypothetical protein